MLWGLVPNAAQIKCGVIKWFCVCRSTIALSNPGRFVSWDWETESRIGQKTTKNDKDLTKNDEKFDWKNQKMGKNDQKVTLRRL